MYLKDEGRAWMVVVMYEERETILKMKKNDIVIKYNVK